MNDNNLIKLLNENDYHLDPLGRMVIDNPEILNAINGAMSDMNLLAPNTCNVGCVNSGCCG